MTVYRLEALRANAGPHLFPRVFDSVNEACDYAEATLPVMGPHAAWKMVGYRVKDTWTSRVVTTVHWHDPNDPNDPDPFAPEPYAGGVTLDADLPAPATTSAGGSTRDTAGPPGGKPGAETGEDGSPAAAPRSLPGR